MSVAAPHSYVSWSTEWPDYKPVDFTHREVLQNYSDFKGQAEKCWADAEDVTQVRSHEKHPGIRPQTPGREWKRAEAYCSNLRHRIIWSLELASGNV